MPHDMNKIKTRSFWSMGSLFLNSSYSAVLGFTAFFILTFKSQIYLLGIYNTVLAMMSFFNYFTNLGLAAAIVQKKEIEEIDLNTVFWIQLGLSTFAVIVGYFLTNHIFQFYKDLPKETVYLYWSVLASFFLLSLKTIPSVQLEKKIKIYKVVMVQAVENTAFYLSVIILSLMGMEMQSLIVAVLLRSIIGVVMIYAQNPWCPKLMFSFKSAKELLSFGLMFQGNSFLALIKDDLLIIYLGSVIGMTNLGYVSFAKKYGEFALKMIMDSVNRVAFPIFCRFQNDKEMLINSIEKVMFYNSVLIFPAIIGAMFIFDNVLHLFPGYYLKWHQSLFMFYIFSLSAFFISISTPFINLFNASGRVKLSLYFMVFWTVLIWVLVPLFNTLYGLNGIAYAFLALSFTSIIVLITAYKIVKFSLVNIFKDVLFSCSGLLVYLGIVRLIFGGNPLLHIIISVIGAPLIYFLILYKQEGNDFYLKIFAFFNRNEEKF